jgi:hypothetical protein
VLDSFTSTFDFSGLSFDVGMRTVLRPFKLRHLTHQPGRLCLLLQAAKLSDAALLLTQLTSPVSVCCCVMCQQVLDSFTSTFDFSGLSFDVGLLTFLESFKLPC